MSFVRKYIKQLLDTGLDSLKTASKKVVPEIDNVLENKTAATATNWHNDQQHLLKK